MLSEPGSRFEFQTTSRTHAPYASGIRVIQQYRLSALGADMCHLDLRYLVVYLGPVNGVLRAMIERGVKGGMQTNAKQLREHLGQVLDVVLVPREEARQQAEQYRLHILRSAAELAPTASARSAGPTAKPVRVPLDAWHHSPWHHRLALMLAVSILVLSVLLLLVMLAELLRPGALLPKLSRLSAEALILSWALGRAIDAVTQAIVLPQGSTRAMAASSRPSRLPLALPAAVTRQESSSSSQPLETMGPSEKTAHGDSHLQPIALPALDNDGKPPVLLSTPGAKRRLLSSPVEFGSPSRSNLGSPRPRLRLAVNVGGFELEL